MDVLVSIIMPVYNASRFLDEAISSVLSQTYPYWELLIVDDHSSDNSVDIINKYLIKDNRIRLYQTTSPSGSPSTPRNIATKHAQGRFIAFLDSDDVWMPSKLEKQIPLFEDSHTAVVYSDYEKMSEFGMRLNRIIHAPESTNYKHLLRGNVIANVTGVYDTQKVGKVYFKQIPHEDYVLWLEILKKGYVAKNVGDVTSLYRLRKQSVSSNKLNTLMWQWNIYVNVEQIHPIIALYYFSFYAIKASLKALK